MKRKLITQIKNEWRSNTWLAVELLIVSVVLWYVSDLITYQMALRMEPMGVDSENVYELQLRILSPTSPSYITPAPEEGETAEKAAARANREAYAEIINRLRALPYVKAVGGANSLPYNYNFHGWPIDVHTQFGDTLKQISYLNNIKVTEDYPKVFNLHGINGETPGQLSEILKEGKFIITSNAAGRYTSNAQVDPHSLVNRKVTQGDNETEYVIGAVVPPIKRNEYESAYHATVLKPSAVPSVTSIVVRVNDGEGGEKLAQYVGSMQGQKELSVINLYPVRLESIKHKRDILHRDQDAGIRNFVLAMLFLLITVFLGLLGSFWFRTQQRVKEIAIRKVNGASNANIFRRLISEGLLLLVMVYPVVMVIEALLVHYEIQTSAIIYSQISEMKVAWLRGLCESLAVFVMMAVMIMAGIYFPARKAMRVEPAEVLRGE